jgi:LPS-assembly lipoprotein
MNRTAIIAVLCVAVSGCGGWHLRGTQWAGSGLERIELRDSGAPSVAAQIRTVLGHSGIALVTAGTPADATIVIGNEIFDNRVLSIDAVTGKVREVEVALQIEFELLDGQGQTVIAPQTMQWQRDYVYDEAALLGTYEQDSVMRRNLVEDAATVILLRLEALPSLTSAGGE